MPCYLLLSFLRFCRTFGFLLGLVLQSMEDTAEKRVRILQTVRDLVLERGLQNVSMSLISKSTKVPIGSIYNLFPSKEALVNAVYVYCRDSFYQSVIHSELDSGSGFEVNFKIFVRRYIHSAIDHAQNYLFVEQYHLSTAIDPVVISDSNIFMGAAGQDPLAIQEKHGAWLQSNGTDRQRFQSCTGEDFRKQSAGGDHGQHASVPVVVIPDHLHRAGQNHPHKPGRLPLQKYRISLGNADDFSIQTAKRIRYFPLRDSRKQWALGHNIKICFHRFFFVGIPT